MQPIVGASAVAANAGLVLLYAHPLNSAPSVVRLSPPLLVVGREPPPGGLRIEQSSVSRMHVRIALAGEAWRLTDLGSRNGTFVDGQRVRGEIALREGAEIRIGDTIFKVVLRDVEAYAPYQIDGSLVPGTSRRSTCAPELVGGYRMDVVAQSIEAVARTPLAVLVLGETGTGKELVARAVHQASGRTGALCAINCAAVPAQLFESELFGFRRGAFTGADRDHPGIIRAAEGGTLFLDEIGDMPPEAQAKLLRVLETREVRAIGATKSEPVDVRIVCATHRDLVSLVNEGRFRADLYGRLNGYGIALPPLRERKEDLYQLVRHFLARAGGSHLRVTFGFMAAVCDYDWPFNVRECQAAIQRAVAVADGPELRVAQLPEALQRSAQSYGDRTSGGGDVDAATTTRKATKKEPTADELRALLARHGGNLASVAREVGKDRKQVQRWLQRHKIEPGDYRG
jgi:transcriptional regulator with GAF, ATPase, and Fis domain